MTEPGNHHTSTSASPGSPKKCSTGPFAQIQSDGPASLVVFLVALPLCLGIALASGAPLISGVIAGIVGGILVGVLSGSALGVSGPAAGLAVIVLAAIQDLGSFEVFLVAVVLAGCIQLAVGYAKAGIIAYYFPSSVITGMLSGIGIIIFLKQLPHVFGYDADPVGDVSFHQSDGENTFTELRHLLDPISFGPLSVAVLSLAILILWETKRFRSKKIFSLIPGPLVAVVSGIVMNVMFRSNETLALTAEQVVRIPVADGLSGLSSFLTVPDFATGLSTGAVYSTAIVIALVASLETLLCVEAADKLDPEKRVTPTNRELKAQGVGNMVSGFLGGLPVTQVIVRSSANVQSGGRTKTSAILHGVLLLISVIALPGLLNMIPLATLGAVLLVVGYKLAKPSIFKRLYGQGAGQFIPFVATIAGIVLTDLLMGIGLGLCVATVVILFQNYQLPFKVHNIEQAEGERVRIALAQQVTFLNKASVLKTLASIPAQSTVEIDASGSAYIHHDVIEIINDFVVAAKARAIDVVVIGLDSHQQVESPDAIGVTVDLPGDSKIGDTEKESVK